MLLLVYNMNKINWLNCCRALNPEVFVFTIYY